MNYKFITYLQTYLKSVMQAVSKQAKLCIPLHTELSQFYYFEQNCFFIFCQKFQNISLHPCYLVQQPLLFSSGMWTRGDHNKSV